MRRFWDRATAERDGSGFAIRLDGKPMRLPGAAALRIPGRHLAEAIAAEWNAAGGGIGGDFSPDDVPLTRLAATAAERIAPDPGPTIDALAQYAQSDLLCYRAHAPAALVARQEASWQPWLDRAAALHGAELRVVRGVMPVAQPPQAIDALRATLAGRTPHELAGLGVLVPAMASLLLGLAVCDGALAAAEAAALAFLDDDFQAEQWGDDGEAVSRRRAVADDIACAARFIELSVRADGRLGGA